MTDEADSAALPAVRAAVRAAGAWVVALPPNVLITNLPNDARSAIRALPGVRLVTSQAPPLGVPMSDRSAQQGLHYFRSAANGTMAAMRERLRHSKAPHPYETVRPPFQPLSGPRIQGRLRATTNSHVSLTSAMEEDTAITVFFAESVGVNNVYTWTIADSNATGDRVLDAVIWWSQVASQYGRYLSFSIGFRYPPYTNVTVEPILASASDTSTWINQIMANYGYTYEGQNPYDTSLNRVAQYNLNRAIAAQTRHAFSLFVAYNPPGAPNGFGGSSDATAFAILGGPYVVQPFGYNGSTDHFSPTFAHEMGHMYWGCDEYVATNFACSSNCQNCDVHADGPRPFVPNGNCEASTCNSASSSCVMRYWWAAYADHLTCSWTRQQVGLQYAF